MMKAMSYPGRIFSSRQAKSPFRRDSGSNPYRGPGLLSRLARSGLLSVLLASPLLAGEDFPLPLAITPLNLSEPHLAGKQGRTSYTFAMSDGISAPELLFHQNRAYLIWTDAGRNGRISLLSADLSRIERNVAKISGRRIADAVYDGKGFVLLTIEWSGSGKKLNEHTAHIEAYNPDGKLRFRTRIVGTLEYKKEGDQGIDTTFGTFNLQWSGKVYAAYFSTYRKWDDGVVHQSEYLALFDEKGNLQKNANGNPEGWNWNVSHSFRPRMVWDGKRFLMSTVGDAYPRGLVVQHYPDHSREVAIKVPA
ncbi:MAG: hypothetical protein KDK23_15700, partial [Leptospiraceae bacterium]|nr:hypothetical protein [Leptospiraceae bacterium]